MADAVELQISVNSIKRVDPYVKEILMTATHVALYKFCYIRNEWMRTEIEGALFVYSRNGEPYHSFMVMNRLNTVNQIEPLVKEFDYQTQSPFLLYRNSKNKIYGIWFYNKDECDSITSLLKTIMTSLKDQPCEKTEKKQENMGILSMLSKAQEDFSKTPVKNETQPQFSSTPRPTVPDVTSQSVMEFFAKASGKATAQKPATIPVGTGDNILQRLMSNPAHSVEHIEKQQRSVTPQELNAAKHKAGDRRSVPINFPGAAGDGKTESVMNFFRVASPLQQNSTQNAASPLTTFLMHSQSAAAPDEPPDVSGTSPLAQLLETPHKPALMPPMMFASSSKNETNYLTNSLNAERFRNVEPLTKNQMLQALNYLLRTDSDFVVKLHEAYVKSFTEMVRNNTIN